MLLGVIPMICFGFLGIFGEKSQKSNLENLGTPGLGVTTSMVDAQLVHYKVRARLMSYRPSMVDAQLVR